MRFGISGLSAPGPSQWADLLGAIRGEAPQGCEQAWQACLADGIAGQVPWQRRKKRVLANQIAKPAAKVVTDFRARSRHLIGQFSATVNDGNDVLQIVACEKVALPRSRKASIFVARNNGLVRTRIMRPLGN